MEFAWSSGGPAAFANWSPVEPNNPHSGEPGDWEYYVHLWSPADANAARWNNGSDTNVLAGYPLNGVVELDELPSRPRLQIASSSNTSHLCWLAPAGTTNRLQSCADLGAGETAWRDGFSPFTGAGLPITVNDARRSDAARFYRVRLTP